MEIVLDIIIRKHEPPTKQMGVKTNQTSFLHGNRRGTKIMSTCDVTKRTARTLLTNKLKIGGKIFDN